VLLTCLTRATATPSKVLNSSSSRLVPLAQARLLAPVALGPPPVLAAPAHPQALLALTQLPAPAGLALCSVPAAPPPRLALLRRSLVGWASSRRSSKSRLFGMQLGSSVVFLRPAGRALESNE